MLKEFADGVLALGDGGKIRRGFGQPERQQTGSRGSLRPIDSLQQRTFARAIGRYEEFEVTGRGRIQEDGRTQLGLDESEEVLRPVAERIGDIT